MAYVAQLNADRICTSVADLAVMPAGPLFVAIDSLDLSLLGRHHDGQAWGPAVAQPVHAATVTRRQAKQALLLAGKLSLVQPAIDAIADATQRAMVQIEWDDSQVFERSRPTLIALATALGMTAQDIDELFATAAALP